MLENDNISIKNKKLFLKTAEYGMWTLSVSDVELIGEYTNEEGPFLEDHFLVFVTSSEEIYETPVSVDGFNEVVEQLSNMLGYNISITLHLNTTFKSRVAYPEGMKDLALFDISAKRNERSSFVKKIKSFFEFPEYTMELNKEVKKYLASCR